MKIGYFLSSEESGPHDLVTQAVAGQEAAFFEAYRDKVLPRL